MNKLLYRSITLHLLHVFLFFSHDEAIRTINTTPLVDIMLLLLIISLITLRAILDTIPINLSEESNIAYTAKPKNVRLTVNKTGNIFCYEP